MTRRMERRTLAAGGTLALALALPLALAPAVLGAGGSVSIAGFAFSPATVTVSVGDTVTWSNSDNVGHTATADDGSFDTGTIAGGSSGAVTFDTAGTFAYHCTIHATMTGTVVVEAAAASPSPSPSPSPAASAAPSSSPTSSPTAPATDTVGRTERVADGGLAWPATAMALLLALIGAGSLLVLRLRSADAEDDELR